MDVTKDELRAAALEIFGEGLSNAEYIRRLSEESYLNTPETTVHGWWNGRTIPGIAVPLVDRLIKEASTKRKRREREGG